VLAAGDAVAGYDYCEKNLESKNVVYFFDTQSLQKTDDQIIYAEGSKTILNEKLEMGDKFTAVKRSPGGGISLVSFPHRCYPGCKPQDIGEIILGTSCHHVIVQRDVKQFRKTWSNTIYINAGPGFVNQGKIEPVEPDIRVLLDKYLPDSKPDSKEGTILYIYSQMTIGSDVSEESLDRLFVNLAIKDAIPSGSLREVNVFGIKDVSGPIVKFWEDYFEAAGAESINFSSQLH
jgi:hypothetical protein